MFTRPHHQRINGVTRLTMHDLAATKILANSDRELDASTLTRDIIDLAMLQLRHALCRWFPNDYAT